MTMDRPPVMIAVMGATGTGDAIYTTTTHDKLISYYTTCVTRKIDGNENIKIGHGQDSETNDIGVWEFFDKTTGRQVVLIDTPGFDDSRGDDPDADQKLSDVDILQMIVDFLTTELPHAQTQLMPLSGIVFMHRISDPKVGGTAKKNLRMFTKLCGSKSLKNVIIATTNWGRVEPAEGAKREDELKQTKFFGHLLEAGAQMTRHDSECTSALAIMAPLIGRTPIPLQIQEEVRNGVPIADTAAGSVLTQYVKALEKKHAKDLADLKIEIASAAKEKNEELQRELREERKELEAKMAKAEEERIKLEKMVAKSKRGALRQFFSKWDDEMEEIGAVGRQAGGTTGEVAALTFGLLPGAVVAAARTLF